MIGSWSAVALVAHILAPPPTADAVRRSAERALPLLRKAAEGHIDQKSCFACHNQTLPALAMTTARTAGFDVPPAFFEKQREHVSEFLDKNREKYRTGKGTGGDADTAGYALLLLELCGAKPDETTAAVAEYLLLHHRERDHWHTTSNRPPSEASHFTTTYLALRGLRVWSTPDQQERVQKRRKAAREWLSDATSRDTEDRVFHLLALNELNEDCRQAASELKNLQRYDGGWGQTATLASDGYATGSVLWALHKVGALRPTDKAFQRGLGFLVRSQRADGSWLVRSRSKPFQPYYESGFPHGKDQFISAMASSWATAALAAAVESGGKSR